VGVALEGRRLDRLESLVGEAPDKPAILGYALRVCQKLVVNRDFRQQVRAAVMLLVVGWGRLIAVGGDVLRSLHGNVRVQRLVQDGVLYQTGLCDFRA
jgi:hypothetical protein